MNEVKSHIKEQFIKFMELTEIETKKDAKNIESGFNLFWIGLAVISIPIFYSAIFLK
jgi:hypothetical protein